MSLMMMLAMSRKRYVPQSYSKTFTANDTFIVPAGVSVLDSAYGHGGPGQPAVAGSNYYYTDVVTRYYKNAGGTDTVTNTVDGWSTGTGNGTDYCDPVQNINDSTVYYASQTCYYYRALFNQGGSAATTGASATGFGKVFPGGTGGPAISDATFTNVPVTAKASYSVVVPSGGSVTITWKV